jgi:hypothetical protein
MVFWTSSGIPGSFVILKVMSCRLVLVSWVVSIANIRSRNEKEYSYIEFYLRPFTIKHYDFEWYEKLTDEGRLTLLEALSIIHNHRSQDD